MKSDLWDAAISTEMRIKGDWLVEVVACCGKNSMHRAFKGLLTVQQPEAISVADELYQSLPEFNPNVSGWKRGERLVGVRANECTTSNSLDPDSVKVRPATDESAKPFVRGRDFELDNEWGTIGRLPTSRIGAKQAVLISYRFVKLRLDSVVLTGNGELMLRRGESHIATPLPPLLGEGERRIGNIYLSGRRLAGKLNPDCLFPILEFTCPESPKSSSSIAEQCLPVAMKKLRDGQRLKVLAWGDSVTDGRYLPAGDRWQEQFVRRLNQKYAKAKIELITEGWGGQSTNSFLEAPPGHEHNYRDKVLGQRPDLIVSEFVNDAGLNASQVEERYGRLLADFRGIGAEWIILTPHYVFPEWMGLTIERRIDDDPREYVKALRTFAARHNVALADGAMRYGRLWRQGLPYTTLMMNTLNHPDARGMTIFADSLMAIFP